MREVVDNAKESGDKTLDLSSTKGGPKLKVNLSKNEKPRIEVDHEVFLDIKSDSGKAVSKNYVKGVAKTFKESGVKIKPGLRQTLIDYTRSIKGHFTWENMELDVKRSKDKEKQLVPVAFIKSGFNEYRDFVLNKRGQTKENIMTKLMADYGKEFFKLSVSFIPIKETEKECSEELISNKSEPTPNTILSIRRSNRILESSSATMSNDYDFYRPSKMGIFI